MGSEGDVAHPAPPPATRWVRWGAGAAVAAALVGWTYGPGAGSYFVGDDLEELWRAVGTEGGPGPGTNLRPLTLLSLRLGHAVWGLEPLGHHLVNIALHLACTGLVAVVAAGLVRRLGPDGPGATALGRRAAVLGAGVFLVLPSHTEAVSWILGRADLLATLAGLGALAAWLARLRARSWATVVALASFAVALLAKEAAVVLPLVVLVVEVAERRPRDRTALGAAIAAVAPWAAVLAAYLALRRVLRGGFLASYDATGDLDLHPLRVAARVPVLVVRSLLPGLPPAGWLVVAVVVVPLGGAAAWAVGRDPRARRALRPAGVALVAASVAVVPAAGLGVSLTDTRGERLVYLASAFTSIAVGCAAAVVLDPGRLRAGPAGRAGGAHPVRVVVGVAGAAALVATATATRGIDQRWRAAGGLSEALLTDERPWAGGRPVVVLNPPDTLEGAYVLRNALGPAAVLVHGRSDPTTVTEVAPLRWGDPGDRVSVTRVGERRWRLRLASTGLGFTAVADGAATWDVPGVTAERRGDRELDVELGPEIDPADVWYVSDGTLHPLEAHR